MPTKYDKTPEEASKDLQLKNEEQDWGIVNANSDRIEEFISYFNEHKSSKNKSFKYYMVELIVASYNDAILENKITRITKNEFRNFIIENMHEEAYGSIFRYWIKIADNTEFPVGDYLYDLIK